MLLYRFLIIVQKIRPFADLALGSHIRFISYESGE